MQHSDTFFEKLVDYFVYKFFVSRNSICGYDNNVFFVKLYFVVLAMQMGEKEENIFLADIGKVLEIDEDGARFNGTVPSGKILVDGYGVGDVGSIVLRDRRHLAEDGIIVVVTTLHMDEKLVMAGPDIVSRGFVYVRESEELMDDLKELSLAVIETCFDNGISDFAQIKNKIKDELSKYIYQKTKRRPMILPIIMSL